MLLHHFDDDSSSMITLLILKVLNRIIAIYNINYFFIVFVLN